MGEKILYQQLTKKDIITVILYRLGIILSTVIIGFSAVIISNDAFYLYKPYDVLLMVFVFLLYTSIGLSVFFIHLYAGRLYRMQRNIYYISLACLVLLYVFGKGNPAHALIHIPASSLLLLPLSFNLGFITAKEAFCFRLYEGYLLALIMPAFILIISTGTLNRYRIVYGLSLIAVMLVFFTLRKVFMPIHYDIGDKSAYQP